MDRLDTEEDLADREAMLDGVEKRFYERGVSTADQAIEFALDHTNDAETFLRAWRDGHLHEWPEFFDWLAALKSNG